jgi:hypothetical protein
MFFRCGKPACGKQKTQGNNSCNFHRHPLFGPLYAASLQGEVQSLFHGSRSTGMFQHY